MNKIKSINVVIICATLILIFLISKFIPRYENVKIDVARGYKTITVTAQYDKWTNNYYYKESNCFIKYNPINGTKDVVKYQN